MSVPPEPATPTVNAQVLNLIEFLAAYDAQRNPAVRDIAETGMYRLLSANVPKHPAVRVRPSEDVWLRVDFLDLPAEPIVPADLIDLLVEGGRLEADEPPELVSPPTFVPPDALTPEEQATARAENAAAWERDLEPARQWIETVWQPWAADYRSVRKVKKLHRDLFEQRDRLTTDRESVELVWGFGRLRWSVAGGIVDHPLITVPVEIDLQTDDQQIVVRPTGAPSVESRYLHGLPQHDATGYNAVRHSVTAENPDPWDATTLAELVQDLVRAVDDEGVVAATAPRRSASAVADTSWVLHARRRPPNAQAFLDAMRDLYTAHPDAIPAPLRAVMTSEIETVTTHEADERLLLPLATNEEQRRIIRLVQRHPGVTVQGPPGTGKSHTIANLISHYVAYGRRVLVVAEKEQALQVLAEKVPEDIRDLTVSVLGADEVGRRRLETSIQQIQAGVGRVDRVDADQRILQLDTRLDELERELTALDTQLLDARAAEVKTLDGTLTPGAAAAWVADHETRLVHIPDVLAVDAPLPLTAAEFGEFCTLAAEVGSARADQAGYTLPALDQLPDAAEFAELLDRRATVAAAVEGASLADVDRVRQAGTGTLIALAADLRSEAEWRTALNGQWIDQVHRRLDDPLQRQEWERLHHDLGRLRTEAMALRSGLITHRVSVAAGVTVADLEDARQKMAGGGKLGMFARDAKRAVAQCDVDGHQPATADEVALCIAQLQLQDHRRDLYTRWANQAQPLGAAALSQTPEEDVRFALDELGGVLGASPRLAALAERAVAAGLPAPTAASLTDVAVTAETAAGVLDLDSIDARLDAVGEYLRSDVADASPLWRHLADALTDRDRVAWSENVQAVDTLVDIAPAALQLRLLRERLKAAAPLWTSEILQDPARGGKAEEFEDTWRWRRLDCWVASVTALPSPGALQHRIDDLTGERGRTVVELVGERAWRRLVDAIGTPERQALSAYLKAVNRFGKTGGRFAARWLEEMRQALDESKTAVPVWIMPTARALTSFRPTVEPPFDVIVIDEASQINFSALPLLSLAKAAIVVGDDKQTSPENVGLDRQRVFDLMDDYLTGIPKYRTLFDPDNSLYDLAAQKFPDVVMLTEHFRCLPEIIGYSNTVAYDGRVIPLRDKAPHPGWTPLGVITVDGGRRVGDVNADEATVVADLIAELCADPAYEGMTFGVVSLLGTAQSKLINDMLYDRLDLETLQARRIRCGEPANFQGDERDVMVLSTVVDPSGRIGAMTSARDLRRINVAASRARSQLWVVTSVTPEDLPRGDFRAQLIAYCSEPAAPRAIGEGLRERCESELERKVLEHVRSAGFVDVDVQRQVGRHKIDLVVNGPDGRLAIESDADRWRGAEAWRQEQSRVQVLERSGWSFERVRASSYYRDPDATMEPIFDRLALLGIHPDAGVEPPPRTTLRTVIVDSLAPTTDLDLPGAVEDDEDEVVEVPADAVHTPLGTYVEWVPRELPPVSQGNRKQILPGILDIVGVEGPILAGRLYRLYAKAAGQNRTGAAIKRVLADVVKHALRDGTLARIDDRSTPEEITLYLPETEPVLVRDRGPRDLTDIPRSEVRALMDLLELGAELDEDGRRAVLGEYGITRLTGKARAYLDRSAAPHRGAAVGNDHDRSSSLRGE
ncbi:AAA domain-containing protein [Nakamurella alba]|uniref:AAA domain-containing protein n=1 Tax=Nakamurella alba TaxID=2665158 RepID=UPI0018A9DF9B|nr:AAA domain-containing protein [Nakamurella alba]